MKEQKIVMGKNDISKDDINSVNKLLRQFNPSALPITFKKIKEVMQFGIIITARNVSRENMLIGIGILIPMRKLLSFCGSIEEVIVDESYAGLELRKQITKDLILKGKDMGMKFVDLTSKPERQEVTWMYQSLGFEQRKTIPYRLFF